MTPFKFSIELNVSCTRMLDTRKGCNFPKNEFCWIVKILPNLPPSAIGAGWDGWVPMLLIKAIEKSLGFYRHVNMMPSLPIGITSSAYKVRIYVLGLSSDSQREQPSNLISQSV